VFGHTTGQHDVGERLDDTETIDTTGDADRQAFTAVFVDQRQQSELAAVMRLRLDEIITPHMIAVLGRNRMQDPSLSHSRPRGLCFFGTFSPSRRQMRLTRSVPTDHPVSLSIRVIRR
jgi:hypothetical protein